MGLTTILRGFKVSIAVLDRFLEANRVERTCGYTPSYYRPELDAGSMFLRIKLAAAAGDNKARIFIPQVEAQPRSSYTYVAYAWVMIYAQRKVDLAEDLPDRAPPSFAELRSEILGFANAEDEVEKRQVRRLEGEGEDSTAALFVVVADGQPYSFARFPRKSDLRCDCCDETFDDSGQRQVHRGTPMGWN
ncbi:hypothetical protein C8A03DRAFT_38998 [Achaetomium macrosporum]|uniref:C2H2-type domain-containing protein n=1 Tax=Achaetomium macrosporum TaxID=79813 RepID=A0AAN7C2H0_9PEZI|nr:hypothetical protein C8A03DRAFT_38998 [Achaetomium macrosporum]